VWTPFITKCTITFPPHNRAREAASKACSPCFVKHGAGTRRVALLRVVDALLATPFTKNKQSIIICGVITTSASKNVTRHRLNHRYNIQSLRAAGRPARYDGFLSLIPGVTSIEGSIAVRKANVGMISIVTVPSCYVWGKWFLTHHR
jgi:hypothetical protein